MSRKPPVRHNVRRHTREGKPVKGFVRGSGTAKKIPHKVVKKVAKGLTLPKKRIKVKVFNEIISQYPEWEKDYQYETLKSGHMGWKHKDGRRRITIAYTASDVYYTNFTIYDTMKDRLIEDPPGWRYGSKHVIIPEVIMFLEGVI